MSDSSDPQPTPREYDIYHLALGRFVAAFALVERTLQGLVGETARSSKPLTRELFGGLTVNAASDTLKRVRKAMERPDCETLDRALSQLRILANVRNRVLHQGATVFPGGSSRTVQGYARANQVSFDVSPDRLWEMTQDLDTIRSALVAEVLKIHHFQPADYRRLAQDALAPWRYKPSA